MYALGLLAFNGYKLMNTRDFKIAGRIVSLYGRDMFRPPYGKKLILLPLALQQRGMTTVMWSPSPIHIRKWPATRRASRTM